MSDLSISTQSSILSIAKHHSAFKSGLLFLWRLAWNSRLRLPYLIVIAFMILDLRLTIEVNVEVDGDDDSDDDNVPTDSEGSDDGSPIDSDES